ncbi:MAG: cobalt-precorrin-6A reductase [Rhizobiales bacterium]|nr:cobalt-precorrin-6A reductase [Hyphomicrobiales bacterium]MBA70465.1 cobalt-precorrin-6A reductase [Hyphomicrobiales bacterium]
MTETILILGGTREGAELAARLVMSRPEARVVTSLAGRTKEPAPLSGEVRIGGFGGAAGLADWMKNNTVTALIDATHPYAETISANAVAGAETAGVPLLRIARPAWPPEAGDRWIEVRDLEAAVDAVPGRSVSFLALGSQHVGAFSVRPDCHFIVRMVDPPESPLPFDAEIVLGRPGADATSEEALFRAYDIDCIVCRNSGGDAGYAKIAAARNLGLPVIMIARPPSSSAGHATVDDLLAALG